jgi:hypothetical protein
MFRGGDNVYDTNAGVNQSLLGVNFAVVEGIITNGSTAGTVILRARGDAAAKFTVLGTKSKLTVR